MTSVNLNDSKTILARSLSDAPGMILRRKISAWMKAKMNINLN
jgi:hypothetical protein